MHPFFVRAGAVFFAFVAGAAAPADTFDKPIDTKVVKLPPDPANPQAKPNRTCWYYPGFVVKQIDLGEKGAAELAIAPGRARGCTPKLRGEMVIKGDYSFGYFVGVKSEFVFFSAADGTNDGLPFGVFSAETGKQLFGDSVRLNDLISVALQDGVLVMRYRRVWLAPCSLMSDGAGCWKKIMVATSLSDSARPDCSAKYRDAMKASPKYAEEIKRSPTVIGYAVEARFAGGKPSFRPTGGRAQCWLED